MFPAIANSLDEKQAGMESGLSAMGYCLALALLPEQTRQLHPNPFANTRNSLSLISVFTPKLLKPTNKRGYREAEL